MGGAEKAEPISIFHISSSEVSSEAATVPSGQRRRDRPRGQHAGKVRVRQVEVLLDLLGHRIDGREVAFHAPDRGGVAGIPAALAIVLGPIDLDIMAAGQGWDVDELGPRTVKNLANNCCRPGWTGRPA